jgi:hypothetical protein
MTAAQEAIRLHQLWLNDPSTGERLNLTGANMRMALLTDANLGNAYLKNACFYQAKMESANFHYASLSFASFAFADMKACDMAHAQMQSAAMWYTTLEDNFRCIPDPRLRCPHRHLIELTPEQQEAIEIRQKPGEKMEETITRLALENAATPLTTP